MEDISFKEKVSTVLDDLMKLATSLLKLCLVAA